MFRSALACVVVLAVVVTGASFGAGAAAGERQTFTVYPAFSGARGPVETVTDKGLMVELIVRCRNGAGIITYSKVEDLYCGPDFRCTPNLDRAVGRLCR